MIQFHYSGIGEEEKEKVSIEGEGNAHMYYVLAATILEFRVRTTYTRYGRFTVTQTRPFKRTSECEVSTILTSVINNHYYSNHKLLIMIYVLTCDICPTTYFKSESVEAVKKSFTKGLTNPEKWLNHPSFKIQVLTLDLLEELAPDDEFVLSDDTGF